MRILIAAVGRARQGPIKELYDDYTCRLPWPVTLKEISAGKGRRAAERMKREAELLAAAAKGATIVCLDARGEALSSETFASKIEDWAGRSADLAFLIGGPDGVDEALRRRADFTLSLGPMTWPHLLARAMLVEQLYRASSILAGHPYHRE